MSTRLFEFWWGPGEDGGKKTSIIKKGVRDLENKVKSLERSALMMPKQQSNNETNNPNLYAIRTYHPSFSGFKKTIQENWDLLMRNKTTRFLHKMPIIFGLRRPPNLRSQLVKARLSPENTPPPRPTKRCKRKLCRYCQKLDLSGRIISPVSHRACRTRTNASCQSQNLIYALQCTSCNKIYVGQTKRQLTKRLCEHFKTIETENDQKSQ